MAGRRSGHAWRLSAAAPVTLGALLWGLVLGLRPLSDNSFLTHLATGRIILATGRVPTTDPYSFTALGADWVVQSWLASGLYAAVERLSGGAGLVALHGVLFVALASIVVAITRSADGLLTRVGFTALALAIGSGLWSERPLLFGLILFGVTLLVVERGSDPRALVVVFALWVNLHGSFPLGIVLLLCVAGGTAMDRLPTLHARRCIAWAGLGVGLGVVNPLGPRLVLFPVELLERSEALRRVVEWQSPTFQSLGERAWLLQLLAATLLLVRRPSYRSAVPLVVFAAASLLAMRNIAVASLALLPGMVAGAGGLGAISARARSAAATALAAVLTGAGAVLILQSTVRPPFELSAYPIAPLATFREAFKPDARIVAPDFVGNYQEAVASQDASVYYDDRFDMFPLEVTAGHLLLAAGGPGWDDVLDEQKADAVVWQRSRPLAELLVLSDRWQVAVSDDEWIVAVRR